MQDTTVSMTKEARTENGRGQKSTRSWLILLCANQGFLTLSL